jgi:glycosyltransferase involved in cell wall biosynthesis
MKAPLVSVIIPCYNCESYLEETIRSVRKQTYPDVELVLVDDGSTDGTQGIIERHSEDAVCHFGPNRGVSAARSTGTELASGDYIQYLDADDHLRPTALERRIESLEEAEADVAYSAYQRLIPDLRNEFREGPVVEKTLEEVHPDPEIATLRSFWLPPVALTYRRRIVEKIGAWNESLPVIQDARFLQDAAFHGARFVKVSEVLAEYRDHDGGSLSTQDQAAFNRDIWMNARQIEERWRAHQGALTADQEQALASVYDHCARSFFGVDRVLFEQASHRVEILASKKKSEQLDRYARAVEQVGYTVSSRIEQIRQGCLRRVKDGLRPLYHKIQRMVES